MAQSLPAHGDAAPQAPSAVRLLARAGRGGTESRGAATAAAGPVRRPPFAWRTRVLLPALLLCGFAGAMAYTARDALVPARPVKVVPVVLAPAGDAGGAAAGTVTVQAPGWLEPDPFAIAVP